MRFFSVLTALVVTATLYMLVFERERLLAFASGEDVVAEVDGAAAPVTEETEALVSVVAVHSMARPVEQVVLARGQTEAARSVEVRAETSGRVVSEPLRKGSFVEEGALLCRIDSGTRSVALDEAQGRLAEAKARVPAAEAALGEAKSRVPAAEAALGEAKSRVPAAEAAVGEAKSRVPAAKAALTEAESRVPAAEAALGEAKSRVPAAEAALADAEGRVPAAEAALDEAKSRVPAAEAGLVEAESRVPAAEAALLQAKAQLPLAEARLAEAQSRLAEARINLNAAERLFEQGYAAETRVAAMRAAVETALAGVEAAKSQAEGARAGVEQAKSQLAGARAGVAQARSQVAGAKAAVISAGSQVETARAGVAQAKSQLAGAKAAVISAESQVETARAAVEQAKSQVESAAAAVISAGASVEGARAAVESARSQLQGAQAAVESAKAQVESASAGIQSAAAAVAAAQTELTRVEIHAPFGGLLETDTAELGSLLQPGGLCATVLQLDPMKLVGFVPETRVDKVEPGARAAARLATGQTVVGQVTFLARAADTATRTFRVEVEVPNPGLSIRDGQTAEIAIEAAGQIGHLLPQSALTLNDEGRLGVRTVGADGRAGFAPVEVLRDAREGVYVAGLPERVDVIVIGQEYVARGVPVAATFRDTAE